MFELIGKRVWVMRDRQGPDNGIEGVVEKVAKDKWIYIKVQDPTGTVTGVWINTDLQREIQVLAE
jgi:RNase P/RNase MRP subunit p29